MKKIFSVIISLFFAVNIFAESVYVRAESENTAQQNTVSKNISSQDIRAVWMTTVFNIDFPSVKNNIDAQKNEYIKKLDLLKAMGINTIVVQVRPKADALYKSAINPWSDILTGTQGKDPGYDPMDFMVKEAHKRGMEFHAWLNPYRITTSGTDLNALSTTSPARLHPNWIITYNNALYYNPEIEEVKKHIVDTVKEIVSNYNIDAIVFDDYFYPSSYPLPQGENKDGAVANSRRQNINDMIQRVSKTIRGIKKNVKFGISPAGIWKNTDSDPTGSNTNGNESYYSVYGDTRSWIKNGWIDYVVPQIYWETGNKAADYETLVKWWSNEVRGTNVKLYIGQGIYNNDVAKEIDTQLKINQNYLEVKGSFYYGMKDLLSNKLGCSDKISAFNKSNPIKIALNVQTNTSTNLPKPNIKTGTVTAKTLFIRSGSGTQYSVIAKVSKGTKVTILNSKTGWYNVKLSNGKIGWASKNYILI